MKSSTHWLDAMDILTLLDNIHNGVNVIGFEDTDKTINDITERLNKRFPIKQEVLESALWSCNLMNENHRFRDYRGLTFDQFVDRILKKDYSLNRDFHFVERKEEDRAK